MTYMNNQDHQRIDLLLLWKIKLILNADQRVRFRLLRVGYVIKF